MRYLLNAGYLLVILVCSPWLIYAAIRRGKYRHGLSEKLWGTAPPRDGEQPCVWFHAVSVGEVQLLKPLLEGVQSRFPGWECVVSTTTQTGFAMARRRYPSHTVFYCPLDFSWSVDHAIRRVRPRLVVLSELELWPNLISAAKRSGAKIAVINGRLSERSFRGYHRIGWLIRAVLRQIDLVAAQNETYAARYRQLGSPTNRVCVTGSLKFDGTLTSRDNPASQSLAELAGIGAEDIVILAGSTQAPEESMVLDAYMTLKSQNPELRLILVPRHPERFEDVAQLLRSSGIPWQRRSDLDSAGQDPNARVLLVDSMGELGAWWGTGQIAYVGGSMGAREGQNMIEPAAFGAAVSFGPRTANFRDIVELLLQHEAAVVVRDTTEFLEFCRRCLQDPNWAAALGCRAQALVLDQQGATQKTLRHLQGLFEGHQIQVTRAA